MLYRGWFGKALGAVTALIFAPPNGWAMLLYVMSGLILGHLIDVWSRLCLEKASRALTATRRLRSIANRLLRQLGFSPPPHPCMSFTFSALGRISKAGGQVKKIHIRYVEDLMRQLKFRPEDRRSAIEWFQLGKDPGFDFSSLGHACAGTQKDTDLLLDMTLECMCLCAWAEGSPTQTTHDVLVRLAGDLGASQETLAAVESRVAVHQGSDLKTSRAIRKAYRILGLTPASTIEDIKLNYRRQLSQVHPDKAAAREALTEAQLKRAEKKTRKLREAYELLLSEAPDPIKH